MAVAAEGARADWPEPDFLRCRAANAEEPVARRIEATRGQGAPWAGRAVNWLQRRNLSGRRAADGGPVPARAASAVQPM